MMHFAKAPKPDGLSQPGSSRHFKVAHALRVAFDPGINDGLRPVQGAFDMLALTLATIFAAFDLFPADHPALRGGTAQKLTLPLVLATAWRGLTTERARLPQIGIFLFAIVGLAFGAVAVAAVILTLAFALLIPKAHAAGYYDSPASYDIAQSWVDFLFKGGDLAGAGIWPFDTATPITAAFISALAFYSDAILIVAAVILFYQLAAMVVETAHEGVVMGKRANQIWAPIRLVVAIGLLVPIGGGLNSGQYIVLKMTQWGSGLASNVWSIFLGGFAENVAMEGVAFVPQLAKEVVTNTFYTQACQFAYGQYHNGGQGSLVTIDPNAANPMTPANSSAAGASINAPQTQKSLEHNSRVCGGYSFPPPTQSSSIVGAATSAAVSANAQSCFQQMQQAVGQYAQQAALQFIPPDVGGSSNQNPQPYNGQLDTYFADYMSCLSSGLPIPSLSWNFAESATYGWASAGALVSSISQSEADANNLSALIPATQPPEMSGAGDPLIHEALSVVAKLRRYIQMIPQNSSSSNAGDIGSDACAANRGKLIDQINSLDIMGKADHHLLERLFQFIDLIAGWNCVYVSAGEASQDGLTPADFSLGIQFQTGANPLAEMAHLGHANINTAYDLFDLYVNLMAKTGEQIAENTTAASMSTKPQAANAAQFLGDASKGALTAIGGILVMVFVVFFVSGVMLAYFVPLIPFMQFLFQLLAWIVSVIEAVVAVPLIALAHLAVEGHGLPGQNARQAYYFVFNIFLRPVLMVFGLVAGLLVLYIAVSYMNLFYEMAISSSGGLAGAHLFLTRLVYSALYVIILYVCTNHAFRMIGWLPEHANKWLGAAPLHHLEVGNVQEARGMMREGANSINQVTGAIQSGGWGAASALGGGNQAGRNKIAGFATKGQTTDDQQTQAKPATPPPSKDAKSGDKGKTDAPPPPPPPRRDE